MRICTACGRSAPEEFSFCGYCGAPLAAPEQPPSRPATATVERRDVTVMFVDVTNFTAASRTLDSEVVFAWMDDTMRLLGSVVDRYEGTIDKFTGDGLMALFGVPQSHENDPERAVLAALAMQDSIGAMRLQVARDYGVDFQARIGINTGAVVAGSVGGERHGAYTVLGDAVNLASRLEKAAEPGTVLVSATTYAATAPLFDYTPMTPILVKGVPEPLQTYRPLQVADHPGSMRGLRGLSAPMVGRDTLLAELRRQLMGVVDSASPLIVISGEAGLGKSRLVSELRRAAGGAVRWVQASCQAHTHFTPLRLIADLLRDLLGLPPAGDEPEQRALIAATLQRLGLPVEVHLPYLAHAIGLAQQDADAARLGSLDAAMLQRQLHTAIRQLVLSIARQTPLVICCDDLHWIDSASRDTLAYLLATLDRTAVGFVLVSREGEIAELRTSAVRAPEQLARAALRALPLAESRALIAGLLGWSASQYPLIDQIALRAAGNPLYIEEILRALIEQDGIVCGERGWELTDRAASVFGRVPHTLRGMILDRFDQLEPGLRSLLHGAAVIGRACSAQLLAQVAIVDSHLAEHQLATLVERGFMARHGSEAEPVYVFPFDLLRDAVYETLLQRNRHYLHRRAADLIAADSTWPADDQVELTAYHYAESDTPQRAIELLVAAGAIAERRYAAESAIRHYRRALDLMQDYPRGQGLIGVRARIGLARSLKASGLFQEAGATLADSIDRLQVLDADRVAWRALYIDALGELADVYLREGALERAVAPLETSLQLLGAADDPQSRRAWQGLTHRLASVRLRQGHLDQAQQLAASATEAGQAQGDPIVLANLYGIRGGVCYEQGFLADAAGFVERSLACYTQVGYLPGMASAYANLGALYYAQGQWGWAIERLERANQLRRAIGYIPEQALTLANLALVRMAMGDHTRADAELHESLALSRRLGDDYGLVRAEIGLGHLAVICGAYADAELHLAQAAGRLAAAGDDEVIQIRWLQALVAAHTGDLAGGLALATDALARAQSTGSSEQRAECLRVLGQLHAQAGDRQQAAELLSAAVDLAIARGDPYQEGLARFARGEALLLGAALAATPGDADARADFHAAEAQFAALGAAWDRARAAQALAKLSIVTA